MPQEKSDRVFAIIERALVPLILGLLVFTNQQAQVRISRAQTNLAEEQARMAVVQSEQDFNIECIKLFFDDICGDNSNRQIVAIKLLELLNDDLARPLAEVASVLATDQAVVAAAHNLRAKIVARELGKNRIELLYVAGDTNCRRIAAQIHDSLEARALAETVVVREVAEKRFKRQNPSGGNAIRFQARTGSDALQRLQPVLASVMPNREFRPVPDEGQRMFRSIQIFLSFQETQPTAPDRAPPRPYKTRPTDSKTPLPSPGVPGKAHPSGERKEGT